MARALGINMATSFGYKAAAGVAVQVYKNLALFGEYRFTHVAQRSSCATRI